MKRSKVKCILALVLITLSVSSIYSQSSDLKLLGRFSDGDVSEFNYKVVNKVAFTEEPGRLVLRICSQDELLSAIALAAGMGVTSGEKGGINATLKGVGYKGEGVFYAVYSGCESKKNRFNTVEYWLVKNGAKLEFDQEIKADDVNLAGHRPESKEEFNSMLETNNKTDENCNEAAKVILGDYNMAPSKKMLKNFKKAEDELKDNKCGHWQFILLKSTEIWEKEPEDDFPGFVVVSKKS